MRLAHRLLSYHSTFESKNSKFTSKNSHLSLLPPQFIPISYLCPIIMDCVSGAFERKPFFVQSFEDFF